MHEQQTRQAHLHTYGALHQPRRSAGWQSANPPGVDSAGQTALQGADFPQQLHCCCCAGAVHAALAPFSAPRLLHERAQGCERGRVQRNECPRRQGHQGGGHLGVGCPQLRLLLAGPWGPCGPACCRRGAAGRCNAGCRVRGLRRRLKCGWRGCHLQASIQHLAQQRRREGHLLQASGQGLRGCRCRVGQCVRGNVTQTGAAP